MMKDEIANGTKIYSWGHTKRYNDFPTFFKGMFDGRVQKLSVNAGFTCPNRDGSKSQSGCFYCNNNTFKPNYCEPETSITDQLEHGIAYVTRKRDIGRFVAYFQSFSNTYAPVAVLKKVYGEALAHPKVHGLVIGTRPDCVNAEILDYIQQLAEQYYVTIEYGVESTKDESLVAINRQHSFEQAQWAIRETAKRGIHAGAHLILGLPGEDEPDFMAHAARLSELPITTLKLHQLQITKNTRFYDEYMADPTVFELFTPEAYLDCLIRFIEHLSPHIVLERFISESHPNYLIAPTWGIKNYQFVERVVARMHELDTYQGRLFNAKSL